MLPTYYQWRQSLVGAPRLPMACASCPFRSDARGCGAAVAEAVGERGGPRQVGAAGGYALCSSGWQSVLLVDRSVEPQHQLSSLQTENRSVCTTRQAEPQLWLGGCWTSSAGGTCRPCRSLRSVLPLRSQQQQHSLAVRQISPQSRCTPSDAPSQRQKGRLLCTLSRSAVLQGIQC